MRQSLYLILIIIVGFIVYGNALKNDFVYDDHVLVIENKLITDWKYLPKIFTTSLPASPNTPSNFYRPIQTLTYLVDYHLFKLKPYGYHLTNIIFHLANAILIFFLTNRLANNVTISAITSLIFVIHPIQTEAVSYVSGRADLLALFFILLSFLLFIDYYWASIFSFILALLSKEVIIIFPFVLLAYGRYFLNMNRAVFKKRHLAFFILLAVYAFLRSAILKFPAEPQALAEINLYHRLLTMLKALLTYFRLLFLPLGLHMERSIEIAGSLFEPQVLGSLIFLILLLTFMIRTFRKLKAASFGLLWFFITLIPVSNIYPLNAYLAEHWLYIPSVGFFIALAVYIDKSPLLEKPALKKLMILFLMFIFSFYSILTIVRNRDWKDDITFFTATLKINPNSPRMHYNLAVRYEEEGLLDKAAEEYELAIKLRPASADAYLGLGNIYHKGNKFEEAAGQYQKALELTPNYADAYNNLGVIDYKKGQLDRAIDAISKAIKINPNEAEYYNNLGAAYADKKLYREAKAAWQKTLQLDPNNTAARGNLKRLEKLGY